MEVEGILYLALFLIFVVIPWWSRTRDRDEDYRRQQAKFLRRCERCGSTVSLHVHHKVPLSLGGNEAPSNLMVLCADCHERHHGYSLGDPDDYEGSERTVKRSKKAVIINSAITEGRRVKIRYRTRDYHTKEVKTTNRVITPIKLFEKDRRIYLNAYCHLRNGERNFRVARITNIELV